MKFDVNKTISLTRGALLDRHNTWRTYFENTPEWKDTALTLTGPLLLASVLLSMVFSRLSGGFVSYGLGHGILVALFISVFMAVLGVALFSFVINLLSGIFGGKRDFARAFAAVTFAMIPAWLAGIVGALIPGVGVLVALVGGIIGLVFLYQILPLALAIPEQKRALHFIASLVLGIVLQMIIGFLLLGGSADR
jgi:MFS family permease